MWGATLSATSLPLLVLVALVLEGHVDLRAIRGDLTVLQLEVHCDHFRDAELPHVICGSLHRVARGILPGRVAGADQLDDFVYAVGHYYSPPLQ